MSVQGLVTRFCKNVSVLKFVILNTRVVLACAGER
jgi:hypothetical protein